MNRKIKRDQDECKDHSNGVKAIATVGSGSSLISKRVSSAGALVRQYPSVCNPSAIAQPPLQKLPSPLSDTNLLIMESMEKLRSTQSASFHHASAVKKKPEESKEEKGRVNASALSLAKDYTHSLNGESANGIEFNRSLNLNDYNELKLRYASMESAYEADRQKTSVLLSKKDAHIARLQERLGSLEQRLDAASQRSTENNHGLIAERDALLDKVQRLEAAFAAEKASWDASLSECQLRLANAERALREKELVLRKTTELTNIPSTPFDQSPVGCSAPPLPSSPSCSNCSYFRRELERAEKNRAELVREKEQLEQENQRKETVLSELSAEATELRVQLNTLNEECKNMKRRGHQFEGEAAWLRGVREKRLVDPTVVADENMLLRKRLNEARDYFEAMDIESEQHITSLTNQLEDLHSALEQKQRDVTLLHNQLKEMEHERDKAQAKIKTCENNYSRQQDVIESLREELDRQKDKIREMVKDRDDVLLRNAGLSHDVELFKREAQKQRDEFHAHLEDVSRELEQCKAKIREQEANVNSSDNGATATLLSANLRINDLEERLRDREATIGMQQRRLSEMKRALQKEWKSVFDNGPVPLSASVPHGLNLEANNGAYGLSPNPFPNPADERLLLHFQYLKNVILRFVTSTDYEATQLVRAVAALLCLTPDEEQLVWDTLKWKMNLTPAAKPKLPLTP